MKFASHHPSDWWIRLFLVVEIVTTLLMAVFLHDILGVRYTQMIPIFLPLRIAIIMVFLAIIFANRYHPAARIAPFWAVTFCVGYAILCPITLFFKGFISPVSYIVMQLLP